MANHPLRAVRPLLDRCIGFDGSAVLVLLALVSTWWGAPVLSLALVAASLPGTARSLFRLLSRTRRPAVAAHQPTATTSAPPALR